MERKAHAHLGACLLCFSELFKALVMNKHSIPPKLMEPRAQTYLSNLPSSIQQQTFRLHNIYPIVLMTLARRVKAHDYCCNHPYTFNRRHCPLMLQKARVLKPSCPLLDDSLKACKPHHARLKPLPDFSHPITYTSGPSQANTHTHTYN